VHYFGFHFQIEKLIDGRMLMYYKYLQRFVNFKPDTGVCSYINAGIAASDGFDTSQGRLFSLHPVCYPHEIPPGFGVQWQPTLLRD
jgi:hypothetical protein